MNICQLSQKAGAAYLRGAGLLLVPVAQIYRGIETNWSVGDLQTGVKVRPCIVCDCVNAMPSIQFTGNWTATLTFMVLSNAFDPPSDGDGTVTGESAEDYHDRIATEVFGKLVETDGQTVPKLGLVQNLSAYDGYTAFYAQLADQGYSIMNDDFVSSLSFSVECCASNIA